MNRAVQKLTKRAVIFESGEILPKTRVFTLKSVCFGSLPKITAHFEPKKVGS
jgi:hypothetical protein